MALPMPSTRPCLMPSGRGKIVLGSQFPVLSKYDFDKTQIACRWARDHLSQLHRHAHASSLRTENSKKNSPQAFQPAGCPVDCLGLTEVVTLVAPRSFRCRAQLVSGGSAHIHGLFARECSRFPRPKVPRELRLELPP